MLKQLAIPSPAVTNRSVIARSSSSGNWQSRLSEIVARWLQRSRSRRALADLDDYLLRDIGLTASEAGRESEKPFWRD
jgi:uncharacterized protein YjiS (DUF1127 family)